MADEQPLAAESRQIDAVSITRYTAGLPAPARAAVACALRSSEVNGRIVIDDLPERVGLLPGGAELVTQHLLADLDTLFTNSAVRASLKSCD